MAPTFRFGSQVGLSPLFSLSISSTLSDVPCIGNLKLDSTTRAGISLSSSGLSRTGPSHKSVRMLSSETLLVITFSLGGVVESGIIAGLVGGVPRPPPRSSWKIGMLERFHMLRLSLYRHHEEIGRFARVSVGEEARTWRLVVCKAGRDGGASLGCAVLCCTVCKTLTKRMTRSRHRFQFMQRRGKLRMEFDTRQDEKRQIAKEAQKKVSEL
jgi:hypothetical protein